MNTEGLCCECGTLRQLGDRLNKTLGRRVIAHPGHVSDVDVRGHSDGYMQHLAARETTRMRGKFDRCVCLAKCSTCEKVTTHAYLRTDAFRDNLEETLYPRPVVES
ncbi:DUF6315 family protein [Rhodococcus koreensis]